MFKFIKQWRAKRRERRDAKAYDAGSAYARVQIREYGGVGHILRAHAEGAYDAIDNGNHPFNRGMRDTISDYERAQKIAATLAAGWKAHTAPARTSEAQIAAMQLDRQAQEQREKRERQARGMSPAQRYDHTNSIGGSGSGYLPPAPAPMFDPAPWLPGYDSTPPAPEPEPYRAGGGGDFGGGGASSSWEASPPPPCDPPSSSSDDSGSCSSSSDSSSSDS